MPWIHSLVLLLLLAPTVLAEDWPQWLGPRRDGSTVEKIAPWKGELKSLWKVDVGEGHSSPVVADGRVYLHSCSRTKDLEIIECVEAESGKPVWRYEYQRGPFQGLFGRGPRGTPSVVDGKLYAFGATGVLTCLDAKKGDKIWQVDTRKEFKSPELKFGDSSSPLVVGNKVLVAVGAKGASIVAFDKDNGSVLWKSLDDKASYASPIVIGSGKETTAVFLTQKGLVGVRLDDGKGLWSFKFEDKLAESSTTPVVVGDKLLISSITLGSALVALDTKSDKTMPTQVWFTKELTCYFSTPVTLGKDDVYLVTGGLSFSPTSSLHCIEAATGKVRWKKANVGKYHACLMRTADDKLLMVEEAGNLVMIEPDPKMYREVARAKICGETWAHPAVANGRLFIRDAKQLVCVSLNP